MTTSSRYALFLTMWAAIHAAESRFFWAVGLVVTIGRIHEEISTYRKERRHGVEPR